jgi:hypothetical protein
MAGRGEIDLSIIDYRVLTPDQWEAVRQEAFRQAHRDRAAALAAGLRWLWSRMFRASPKHAPQPVEHGKRACTC